MMRKLLTALCLSVAATMAQAAFELEGVIVGVSDGDTVTLLDSAKKQHRIRLANIDAPESKQPYGQQSKKSLSDLVYRKLATAKCVDRDRYGRSVCTIFADGLNANATQVARGLAWVYRAYAPKSSPLFAIERDAKNDRIGLWTAQEPTPPWEWRREKR